MLLITLALPCFKGMAQTLRADKGNSSITYTMRHPLHTWSGTSKEVNGLLQLDETGAIRSVAIVTKVKSFDSKNSNRDAHMLEVTDALTYPNVSFKSTRVEPNGTDRLTAKGLLSFHGKEKEVEFTCTFKRDGGQVRVKGNFDFLLEDFNITPPSLMLVKTESQVRIDFEALFTVNK